MRITIKDLLAHKFPMDETEQAILINEISQFEKELNEIRNMGAEGRNKRYKHPTKWITDQVLDELLGDSK